MTTTTTPQQASTQRTGRFQPATRKKSKLRLALDGPAGSGKSYTLLRLAFALAGSNGRVAVIDSEHGSASKYQGDAPDGIPWNFDAVDLHTFAPTEYTAMIEEAGRAGYDVLIIDGLTQAWQGADGALELVSKKGGNSFTAWKDVTPMHNRMIEAILGAPMHVLVSMRSKVEYVLETNAQGKQEPRKIGMAPIQRAGMEYEFDIYGSLDWSHVLTVTKSRCPSVDGQIVVKPGPAFLDPVMRWLDTGEVTPTRRVVSTMADDAAVERIVAKVAELGRTMEYAKKDIFRRYTAAEFCHLTAEQAKDYEKRLDVDLRNRANGQTSTFTPPATPTLPPAAVQAVVTTSTPEAFNGQFTAEQHAQIDALVARLELKPAAVRQLVRDCGCKQGAVKKLTGEQANEVIRRLASGALTEAIASRADGGGQTLQDAMTTAAATPEAADGHANGQPTTPPPNAYTNLAPLDFVVTAFSELALAAGWDKATENANFAAALARRGVNSVRALSTEQLTEFKGNLIAKIKEVYAARGQHAACPFPGE